MKSQLLSLLTLTCAIVAVPTVRADDLSITVTHTSQFGQAPVPIALSGFTGTGLEVLKFDLTVQGFSFVTPDKAAYLVQGSDAGDLSGTVAIAGSRQVVVQGGMNGAAANAGSKHVILSRSYNGASIRREAHAFADEVVQAITGKPGIAETRGGVAKIAFKAQYPGGVGEIYVADFDGSDPVALTSDRAIVAKPAWQTGRMAVYYTSYARGNPDIRYHNLTTGQWRTVVNYHCLNTSAASSPDGSRLAVVTGAAGTPNIWAGSATGSGMKQLTSGLEDSSPCWSPDGQWICYATKYHERRRLAKIPAGGGPAEYLNTTGTPGPTEPDWSPDGKWIAYTCQFGGTFDICVTAADGSIPPQILVAGQNPSWAPNSRTLVFNRGPEGRQTLSVLDVFTKQYKDCHRVAGSCSQPAWAK